MWADTATVRHAPRRVYHCPSCGGEVVACAHHRERVLVRWDVVRAELIQGQWLETIRPATPGEVAALEQDLAAQRAELAQAATEERVTTEDVMAVVHRLAVQPPIRQPLSEEERRRQHLAERIGRAVRAGIPEVLHRAIRAPEDRPALRAVREWAQGDRLGLLLCGSNQAGKSAAAGAWLSTQERGLWATAWEVSLSVQPDAEGQGVARQRQLRQAGALVVDNVGERCGPAGYEVLEALLVHHLGHGRKVVLTSDLESSQVFALFGGGERGRNRIWSRWRLYGAIEEVGPWVSDDTRSDR